MLTKRLYRAAPSSVSLVFSAKAGYLFLEQVEKLVSVNTGPPAVSHHPSAFSLQQKTTVSLWPVIFSLVAISDFLHLQARLLTSHCQCSQWSLIGQTLDKTSITVSSTLLKDRMCACLNDNGPHRLLGRGFI